ncbi:MAG: hypothetical protein JWM33_445 [Caulobacteraceae bacterium]|nr:hypothetical protein [Caulobacteraceae bacterium]
MAKSIVRVGSGAGFAGDRIEPAVDLARRGALDYLVFECLGERTVSLAVSARQKDPEGGYDPLLAERMEAVLPLAVRNGTRIISNMGAANPRAAAQRTAQIARQLGLGSLKIAAITGDDVLTVAMASDLTMMESGATLSTLPSSPISANAYIGAEPIVEALAAGADVVLTGRAADPSLFLAPLIHEFGWAFDDWQTLGRATATCHLLECAGQVTGGYFADPPFKVVPDLANLGFPLAEVASDGSAVITKLPGTGGCVTIATCTEQLLYELHDPTAYLTPDVTADFSGINLRQDGPDRVAIEGGGGGARPSRLKVSIGYHEGYIGEGQISYAGPGCVGRGQLALDIVRERLAWRLGENREARFDLIGCNAVYPGAVSGNEPEEVRARVALRAESAELAALAGREVEALYTNGPAGGGGASASVKPILAIVSALIDRALVKTAIDWEVVP